MKYIKREDIKINAYVEILKKESHHDHKIVEINGIFRWEKIPEKLLIVDECGLNKVVEKMIDLGLDKNSEEWRALYRNLGYSLNGYWEVFYWEMNNPDADSYNCT